MLFILEDIYMYQAFKSDKITLQCYKNEIYRL